MPLQATSGAASYDAFGGGVPVVPNYIEDVFSTYLYTGTGSALTITNNIDLSTKGGLTWIKNRTDANDHGLFDTVRGAGYRLISNTTDAQNYSLNYVSSFNATGFSLGAPSASTNASGQNYVSWTFRKQPKFFDVVTWTGNGTSSRSISHNLKAQAKFIIIKRTDTTSDWVVTADKGAAGEEYYLNLNATTAGTQGTSGPAANGYAGINGASDDTYFNIYSGSSGNSAVNASGGTYVAYIYASNAGGFGLTGTDNVISCGSYTGTGSGDFSGPTVDLGYEPQWILFKKSTDGGGDTNWNMYDNMRGLAMNASQRLMANSSSAEAEIGPPAMQLTATGFRVTNGGYSASGQTYIYIAIRRGPMKVPTVGTSVFSPVAQTNTGSQPFPVTAGFPVDSAWFGQRSGWGVNFITSDRLRGALNILLTTATTSESYNNSTYGPSNSRLDSNTQFFDGMNNASEPDIYWMFRRAPSFFDEVCYTTPGSTVQVVPHNLGVTPELIIVKRRNGVNDWGVQYVPFGSNSALYLNTTDAVGAGGWSYFFTSVTASSITATTSVSGYAAGNYVAYLFATCAGVSKVGSYTGTGALQTVNCGFTSGARFVLIKRTDSTGDWWTYDSARGITSGNDPYLYLNSTASEVTGTNYVDTDSTGFKVTAAAPAGLNASGGTYIFLAIA